jgi:hypothetical protein
LEAAVSIQSQNSLPSIQQSIKAGVYLRNWSPRTARTYLTAFARERSIAINPVNPLSFKTTFHELAQLFGAIFFWAGFLGIVVEGCSIDLTTWMQTAATAFLPGGVTASPCGSGWRLLCAASFWLILSLLIAPAVGRMGDRQNKLNDTLVELRRPIRLDVRQLRDHEGQMQHFIIELDGLEQKRVSKNRGATDLV